jgi:NAD(P)-dependent dehydrogenase (short-subunit alcohol dehydrogenase family)
MNPIYDFKGQGALVTGAAKGMGLATARLFAESGASVVLADLDGDLAAKEADRMVAKGGTAIGIGCDVADEAQVAAMSQSTAGSTWHSTMPASKCRRRTPPTSRSKISSA